MTALALDSRTTLSSVSCDLDLDQIDLSLPWMMAPGTKSFNIDIKPSYFSKLEPLEVHKLLDMDWKNVVTDHSYSVSNQSKCPTCGLALPKRSNNYLIFEHYEANKCKCEPFTCDICNKICRWKSQLMIHKKSHQNKIDFKEPFFKCNICLAPYYHLEDLKRHEEQHSKIKVNDVVTKEQRSKKIILEKR